MNETNKTDAGFYSIFNMVMINGSAPHIHKIYNATVNNMTKQGKNTVFDGAVSITMKDDPVNNVPAPVTIANNTIAISMDPSKINNLFGNTPIYGLMHKLNEGLNVMKFMNNDSADKKKWIPLVTGDMLNSMKGLKTNQTMKIHNDSMAENMSLKDSSMSKGNTTQAVQ